MKNFDRFIEHVSVKHIREQCWRVVLEFGPHCFTLVEYEGPTAQKTAEAAYHSLKKNWLEDCHASG